MAYLVALAYFLPLLAAAVRRLHDTGRSAVVPDRPDTARGLIILIVFLATEGNSGSNAYGSPPGDSPALGSGTVPPPPPPA